MQLQLSIVIEGGVGFGGVDVDVVCGSRLAVKDVRKPQLKKRPKLTQMKADQPRSMQNESSASLQIRLHSRSSLESERWAVG